MVRYFAYGSNMNMTSLRAKGVAPRHSERATLRGWRLAFDVQHWFRHEGGVGNIHPANDPNARVEGVVHTCADEDLRALDLVESRGVGYDRVQVQVHLQDPGSGTDGPIDAFAYVGVPSYLDAQCLPTQRYLNIVIAGAISAGLDDSYVDRLRQHPVVRPDPCPPFVPPIDPADAPVFDQASLARKPSFTALAGSVFDMSACRWQLECVVPLFGGKDMTLFHLRRLDSSDGTETVADIKADRISAAGRAYLNAYLHEYAAEYRYVGRYVYD